MPGRPDSVKGESRPSSPGAAIDAAAFDRLKQLQSSRGNSVLLHELYFDGLALKAADPPDGVRNAVENPAR